MTGPTKPDDTGVADLAAALQAARATWPEQRLGQLIDNAVHDYDRAPLFHISDGELLDALRFYAEAKR